jgi:hypothetical protein
MDSPETIRDGGAVTGLFDRRPGRAPGLGWALSVIGLLGCGTSGTGPSPETAPEQSEPPPAITPIVVALRFAEGESVEHSDVPRTRVVLVMIDPDRGRSTSEIGTYDGACTPSHATTGFFLAATCWWPPHGSEVWVAHENDALVVRHRVGEGASEEVLRLELPEDAELEAIGR